MDIVFNPNYLMMDGFNAIYHAARKFFSRCKDSNVLFLHDAKCLEELPGLFQKFQKNLRPSGTPFTLSIMSKSPSEYLERKESFKTLNNLIQSLF